MGQDEDVLSRYLYHQIILQLIAYKEELYFLLFLLNPYLQEDYTHQKEDIQ